MAGFFSSFLILNKNVQQDLALNEKKKRLTPPTWNTCMVCCWTESTARMFLYRYRPWLCDRMILSHLKDLVSLSLPVWRSMMWSE